MYKATFHVDGDSPYSQSTAGTDTEIRLWCNDHCDLLYITGEKQGDVIDQVRSEVGVQKRLSDANGQVIITESCLEEGAGTYIKPYLVANDCLLLPPWQYRNGIKVVRVLALDSESLSSFYRSLSSDHTVHVESKQELRKGKSETPIFSIKSRLPTLTDRQRKMFLTAYERGYYKIPRETTTAEIAEVVGVGRRTVEHHLRRAEEELADVLAKHV